MTAATVTVTGGPFTDGQGNTLAGQWMFQPVGVLGFQGDDLPLGVNGTLGGWPNVPSQGASPAVQASPGEFSAKLTIGTYIFQLRTATNFIRETVEITTASGTTITIESLLT